MTEAEKLFNSPRGRYIMGQALAIASEALRNSDNPHHEVSNAEDMETLGELFEPFYSLEKEAKKGLFGQKI